MLWNPWHGCQKYSEGCINCYVYRTDGRHERDASEVKKNKDFDLPVKRKRNGEYKLQGGETVYTCFTSDFFLDKADEWRKEAWAMIRERSDLDFLIITKRITRFYESLPADWKDGYENVAICVTCENQKRADERLPFFLSLPIKHKLIICEPLLSAIDLSPYLCNQIENVTIGGESGNEARICNFDWVLDIRRQCIEAGVSFNFRQTGARLVKDGKLYRIKRKFQYAQARKANIDYKPKYYSYKK
jgi:protein gp37